MSKFPSTETAVTDNKQISSSMRYHDGLSYRIDRDENNVRQQMNRQYRNTTGHQPSESRKEKATDTWGYFVDFTTPLQKDIQGRKSATLFHEQRSSY
jgi:hypothetical protein